MSATRRQFLRNAAAMASAAPAYGALSGCTTPRDANGAPGLVNDPDGFLDLPPGFTYQRLSETGEAMSDGFRVPASHDGMGAFAVDGDPDRCVLIRNHELNEDEFEDGPFGADPVLPGGTDADMFYDVAPSGHPLPAGTTTLIYNVSTRELEQSFVSLAGTIRNCSGGITPWGSWLTCEESVATPGSDTSQDHGYVFEVPSTARSMVKSSPIKAMGRFNREAAAVDPRTGIVYQTEDKKDGLIYRYIPNVPGDLMKGGKVQALAISGQPSADTRNWGRGVSFVRGQELTANWIDLDNVEAPDDDLRARGFDKGAAKFARGEGIAWAVEKDGASVYFACTTGGAAEAGQIWRYIPSPFEGTDKESEQPGQLILHYESPDKSEMDMCDNIVSSPWGHLIVCEDGDDGNYLHGVSPDGRVYTIAANVFNDSEFAGACFSPDGETLFVNIQTPGVTLAITGPWQQLVV